VEAGSAFGDEDILLYKIPVDVDVMQVVDDFYRTDATIIMLQLLFIGR
jgi:hypothetical protein